MPSQSVLLATRSSRLIANYETHSRYSKYVPDPAGEMSMEDLLGALSDYLLQSGFQESMWYEMPQGEQTLDELKRAIEQALLNGENFDENLREQIEQMQMDGQLDELIEQLIERMQQEDYISIDDPHDPARQSSVGGQTGEAQQARFEVTDKSLDFLGFKSLRNLLGSLGKSSFGRHDTRDLATGIEASGSSKTYEFGDTMNLDITATLSSAIQREGLTVPLNIEYSDLQVHQCEYQSSCATVLMLDCSHSMILYGEDRFTPAKEGRDGIVASDSHIIPEFPVSGSLPYSAKGDSVVAVGASESGAVLHQHARRLAAGAENLAASAKRHEADRDDHGWKAFGIDPGRWAHLQECFRA